MGHPSFAKTRSSERQGLDPATRPYVIRAIEEITLELAEGTIDPAPARARLYALQTLLGALRMTHPALERKPRRELTAPTLSAE